MIFYSSVNIVNYIEVTFVKRGTLCSMMLGGDGTELILRWPNR